MTRHCFLPVVCFVTGIFAPVISLAQTDAAPASAAVEVFVANSEDLLDYNKTVIVPAALVTLATEGRTTASKQSGLFQRGNATARASVNFKVNGIDKGFAQALAQRAYDDFVSKLRAAGYTVLTYADVKDRDYMKAAQRENGSPPLGLPSKSEGGTTFVTAAPSDEQHFKDGFAGGIFASFIQGGKSIISDGTLIIPHYTLVAPQSWGESSRGYNSVSANVNIAPGMNLTHATAYWLGKPKSRVMRGIPGVATKQQIINITEKAGTLQQTADSTPQTANALSSVLSSLSGAGNIQRSASDYALTIDREAYTAGAMSGIGRFNAEVAKVAAEAKP